MAKVICSKTEERVEVWKVIIPDYVLPSVNKLLNTENYRRNQIKRRATDMILAHCLESKVPFARGPRRVGFLIELTDMRKAPDPDNCWKILLDALVAGALLIDDRSEHVDLGPSAIRRGLSTQTIIFIEDIHAKS